MKKKKQNTTLFEHAAKERLTHEQPLAARLRPRTLDEFIGQDHILAPGRLLRRAIQADRLASVIFYGPPGTGKTTLASVIANTTRSCFVVLNAVLTGVADLREVTQNAQQLFAEQGQRTILFVDEVHRWNKAQQDALLPWVENGTIVLIGATTENPYFTVNRALVSRSRIFQLKPLEPRNLQEVVRRALADPEFGYGKRKVQLDDDALMHLVDVANGDARALLNALELAVETTAVDDDGICRITMTVAEESIQRRAVLYDKEGDYHFDTISAFIKSLRGSDPDAALYWLAKMVYAGEDPRFIFRRLLIFCGEDVGLADPQALVVVQAAATAFDRVGMPEGRYHLGLATLYLATAPKSNSVMGFFDALAAVEKESEGEVPNHLKDASRDKEGFGHGAGYLYPHAYRDHWVAQQYLPEHLRGRVFYQPGFLGPEKDRGAAVLRRREQLLAAGLDSAVPGAPPEILTHSPKDRAFDRWLARTISGSGDNLGALREQMFTLAACLRHERVLDLDGDGGLLVWEAVRQVPEGGVWTLTRESAAAVRLQHQARTSPTLRSPQILTGTINELVGLLEKKGDGDVLFDLILGRNVLGSARNRVDLLRHLVPLLQAETGRLVFCEGIPRETQRLYQLADLATLGSELAEKVRQAEDAIYRRANDHLVNWGPEQVKKWGEEAGLILAPEPVTVVDQVVRQLISQEQLDRWFQRQNSTAARPSYADWLLRVLSTDELERVEALYRHCLPGYQDWHVRHALFCLRLQSRESLREDRKR